MARDDSRMARKSSVCFESLEVSVSILGLVLQPHQELLPDRQKHRPEVPRNHSNIFYLTYIVLYTSVKITGSGEPILVPFIFIIYRIISNYIYYIFRLSFQKSLIPLIFGKTNMNRKVVGVRK